MSKQMTELPPYDELVRRPELWPCVEAMVERLRAIEEALRAIVGWYEQEMERSQWEDDEIPEELRELERALEAAEAAQEPGQ